MYGMSGFAEKIEYPELQKFVKKLCILYMYWMSGFAEKLNIQNYENLTGKWVHYTYGISRLGEKLNIQNYAYSKENCVYYIWMECLDLRRNWMSRTV